MSTCAFYLDVYEYMCILSYIEALLMNPDHKLN